MSSEYEARQALQEMLGRFEPRHEVRRGLLGNSGGTVQVASRPGWAYIRYNDNLNELCLVRYLLQDQLADGTPVRVGKKHPDDPYEQVLGPDWTLYAWAPGASEVAEHATPAIDLEDLSPGKVVPTDPVSLSVDVRAFLYVNGDTAVEFGGSSLDLTANVPGVAGHRMVLVYIDLDTDTLAAEDGAIVAVGVDAESPAVPENGLPLALVDLANGDTEIVVGDIYQYKALYLSVGTVIDLTQLSDYTRGYIIRGGAADWEAYDARGDGYALVGDGTDILSDLTPSWKGTHTWIVGNDESIDVQMDAALATNALQFRDAGGVTGGFDSRGIVFSNGGTLTSNFFAGAGGNATATMGSNIGIGTTALQDLTSGYSNVAIGAEALTDMQNGFYNIAIGTRAMYVDTTGDNNVVVGGQAAYALANGNRNVLVGVQTGYSMVAVNGSVCVGYQAGYTTTGGGHVFLGQYAGYRQAAVSDYLIIDNRQRANAATELTHAIVYGVMAANPEDQTLTANVGAFTTGNDNTPAYGGYRMANDVAGVAVTIITNATGDVTVGLQAMYFVSESGGGTSGGMATVPNGGSADLYDDGTDVLTLAVAADGSTTLQRTAGATTFDVSLWLVWV